LCLANQTGIDLQAAFDKNGFKSVRDKDRHKTTINSNNLSTINYEFQIQVINCEHEL
jgi:hypothetical protein